MSYLGENPNTKNKDELLHPASTVIDESGNTQQEINNDSVRTSELTKTVTEDKLKAPSNLAVNTALKEQGPRSWG